MYGYKLLVELLAGRGDDLELDRAALALAAIEYPDVDAGSFLALLDSYAVELAERLPQPCDGPQFVAAANAYLFDELGFTGGGPQWLVTELGVFDFTGGEARLVQLFPDVSMAEIRAATGFPVEADASTPVTPPPTEAERAALAVVDPDGARRIEFA